MFDEVFTRFLASVDFTVVVDVFVSVIVDVNGFLVAALPHPVFAVSFCE
ncbi:MAG TPA: hypothetical protein VGQ81_11810 [Acidobacteriota bacterium]|nr:hypothetical protein [Acidobacteriota bacterium]